MRNQAPQNHAGIRKYTDPKERCLICRSLLDNETIARLKAEILEFSSKRFGIDSMSAFQNWNISKTEVALVTRYAYADFPAPGKFITIFDIKNTGNFVLENFQLNYIFLDGYAITDKISHGHKHILVLDFGENIPDY